MKKESSSASSNGKRKKESDDKPLAKRGKKESTPLTSAAAKKAKIKEEQEAEIYKWWEEQEQKGMAEDDTIKWTKLEHNGVLFPPDYVPHGVKMKYDGKPITLSPEAEEVASFYAALLETDHGKNPTFQKNFFNDWLKILKKDPQVNISKCSLDDVIQDRLHACICRIQKSHHLKSVISVLSGKSLNATRRRRSKWPRKKSS